MRKAWDTDEFRARWSAAFGAKRLSTWQDRVDRHRWMALAAHTWRRNGDRLAALKAQAWFLRQQLEERGGVATRGGLEVAREAKAE